MPIYEYGCRKCGQVIEKIQKFSDPPLKKHEGCGGSLTKLVSQSSFQFKGSGWYVTDYAGKGKAAEKADGSSEATSDKASAGEDGKSSESPKEPGGGKNTEKPGKSAKDASSSGTKAPKAG